MLVQSFAILLSHFFLFCEIFFYVSFQIFSYIVILGHEFPLSTSLVVLAVPVYEISTPDVCLVI